MPSESAPLHLARTHLAGRCAAHREAAARAADEAEALGRAASAPEPAGEPRAFAATLGPLGVAHVDTDRLAPLFGGDERRLDPAAQQAVRQAARVLREAGAASEVHHLDLEPGADLPAAVRVALARAGRAFGAAHVVALARSGRYDPALHAGWNEAYPFARWNRRERQLAPPLVVTLDGADLKAAGLAEFLDGRVTIVLLVRNEVAPPAALVRLVSPGVFVAQTLDGELLAQLPGCPGPAVVAWVPAGCAAFVHRPEESPALGARLTILSDAVPPRRGLGGQGVAQLADELRQLEAMAGLATAPAGGVAGGASTHPVDRLAAWILTQADLATPGAAG